MKGVYPHKNLYRDNILSLHRRHGDWGMRRIARNAGCTRETVRYHLRANNITEIHPSPQQLLIITSSTLKRYYHEYGMTLQEIGDIYHVSRERVRQVMERCGLKRRRVGRLCLMRHEIACGGNNAKVHDRRA